MSSSTKARKAKKPVPVIEPAADVPFQELISWLEAMALVRGYGGKKEVAERLGIKPDVLSQLFKRHSGLDPKTVKLIMWMITSKAEDYQHLPVLETTRHNGLIFELREIDGVRDWTWRAAAE